MCGLTFQRREDKRGAGTCRGGRGAVLVYHACSPHATAATAEHDVRLPGEAIHGADPIVGKLECGDWCACKGDVGVAQVPRFKGTGLQGGCFISEISEVAGVI